MTETFHYKNFKPIINPGPGYVDIDYDEQAIALNLIDYDKLSKEEKQELLECSPDYKQHFGDALQHFAEFIDPSLINPSLGKDKYDSEIDLICDLKSFDDNPTFHIGREFVMIHFNKTNENKMSDKKFVEKIPKSFMHLYFKYTAKMMFKDMNKEMQNLKNPSKTPAIHDNPTSLERDADK